MRRPVSDIKKEGIILVSINDRGCRMTAPVDVIHVRLHTPHGAIFTRGRDVGYERGLAVLVVNVLETVSCDLWPCPQVPLAKLSSDVADVLQSLSDGQFAIESVQRHTVGLNAKP